MHTRNEKHLLRTWAALIAALAVLPAPALAVHADAKGCKDHPLFTRMPGYWIYNCKESQFDAFKFRIGQPRKAREESVEGRVTQLIYNYDGGGARPSRLQVLRNYDNAAKVQHAEKLYQDDEGWLMLKLVQKGTEFWVAVREYGGSVTLTVVERQDMKQDVVANADAFAKDLEASGHVAVYGILFDTGQAVLKPESEAALAEIAKLLAARPELKVRVVGHTDWVGHLDANLKLSQARAEAALAALTGKHGVAAARLTAHGVGPLAPVATNSTDEGRAQNRRVELVAWQ